MDDRDFFDLLLSGMKDTTHAEDGYWGYEEQPEWDGNHKYGVFVVAQDQPEVKVFIGGFDSEADAAFVAAIHGAFPDLWRRLHMALDEADEKDRKADDAEAVAGSLGQALAECQQARKDVLKYDTTEDWHGKASS